MAAQKVGSRTGTCAVLSLRFGVQVLHPEALDLLQFARLMGCEVAPKVTECKDFSIIELPSRWVDYWQQLM